MSKPIIIAYYLPQFHPTVENDRWWGKGFTEWTNVAKARPLFAGHEQPKVPADLGFYDLRYPEIKEQQAALAREAGISAFCYWHYWLGDGRRLLSTPFEQVVRTGQPEFPFCLGWANHDWQRKDWSSEASIVVRETLIRQTYGGAEDYARHFREMLPAFADGRYLRIDERLAFVVFRPDSIPDTHVFVSTWNDLAAAHGLPGFFFIARTVDKGMASAHLGQGYDAVNLSMLDYAFGIEYTKRSILRRLVMSKLLGWKNVVPYADAIRIFDDPMNGDERVVPTLIPNWDHSPRSGAFGHILHGSTPELFERHAAQVLRSVQEKRLKVIFLASWNEWGEGNYMEPDRRHGTGYVRALARALAEFE